jgi:hypothetical protein
MASHLASQASPHVGFRRNNRKEVKPMEIIAFTVVVVLWICFAALLFLSRASIDEVWTWLGGQPLVVQVPVGFLFLPWVIGMWIWESSWPLAARGLLVGGVAWANIYTFSPWKPFA